MNNLWAQFDDRQLREIFAREEGIAVEKLATFGRTRLEAMLTVLAENRRMVK